MIDRCVAEKCLGIKVNLFDKSTSIDSMDVPVQTGPASLPHSVEFCSRGRSIDSGKRSHHSEGGVSILYTLSTLNEHTVPSTGSREVSIQRHGESGPVVNHGYFDFAPYRSVWTKQENDERYTEA
eukprot:GHVH01000589.1.p3 GENE.GHVH01000589.1~~GHVH01000589.1.p3  ORF type:complete len:125 (-),score=21.42 GHVH01000589.1:500-874(-)